VKGEDMNRGFVKIHRKMLENPVVFKDADHVAVWLYLLLNATHKKIAMLFCGRSIELMPGQLITGRLSIAKKLKVDESKVKRILNFFENEQLIDQRTTPRHRLVTLKAWATYQINDQPNDQLVTNSWPTGDQLVTTNKNVKNVKNVKKEYPAQPNLASYSDEYESFWRAYPRKIGKSQAYKAYRARVKEGAAHSDILKAAANYAASVAGKDPAYIKHPSTFLNPDWRDWLTTTAPDYEAELQRLYPNSYRSN
jgi:hypothetical protein